MKKAFLFSIFYLLCACSLTPKKNQTDLSRYMNLPYNLKGKIEIDSVALISGADSIIGSVSLNKISYTTEIELKSGSEALSGKIKQLQKVELEYGSCSVAGSIADETPNAKKLEGSFGQKFRIDIDICSNRFQGFVYGKSRNSRSLDMLFGNQKVTGRIFDQNDTTYYDLKFGTELILGYRIQSAQVYSLYAGKISKSQFVAFLLLEILSLAASA